MSLASLLAVGEWPERDPELDAKCERDGQETITHMESCCYGNALSCERCQNAAWPAGSMPSYRPRGAR